MSLISVVSCSAEETPSAPPISDITIDNFPIIDGSDSTLSLQKNTTQSHKLQNDQGKTMIAKDSFVPLL